ncbi:MAG: ferritin-like domain-containing protein [Planctomycetaceae bacterium]
MPDAASNAALNRVLIELGRSLLQYVGESWPWSPSSDEDTQRRLDALVERQRAEAERVFNVLSRREWNVDLGGYPTEYTDLHYLALHHLLRLLLESEARVLDEIERAARECANDPPAAALLTEAAAEQRAIVTELRKLCRSTSGAAA